MEKETRYYKSFIPLESDPEIFTELMYKLGISKTLEFVDVYSLEQGCGDALALILVLPDNPAYLTEHSGSHQSDTDVGGPLWLKQTIDNACGLYAILHCVCNIPDIIEKESILDKLIKATDRVQYLEDDGDIESLYGVAAKAGRTEPPSAQAEVAHHYISLVKHSGRLYLLDGEKDGPICKGKLEEGTPWTDPAFAVIREYTNSQVDGGFSLLALVERAG